MTRPGLREYAALQRERYLRAPRAEKRRLLDEVVAVSGLHRKAAIRLLRRPLRPPGGHGRGIGKYGPAPNSRSHGLPAARLAGTPTASRSALMERPHHPPAPSNPDF